MKNLAYPWEPMRFVWFWNFRVLLFSPRFWNSVKVTSLLTVANISLGVFLGLVISLLLQKRTKDKYLFLSIFVAPMFLPPVVVGTLWRYLLNPEYGLYNWLLTLFGFSAIPWIALPSTALLSVIFIELWRCTPFATLVILSGLEGLPKEPFEAARMDGATNWQAFKYITFPLLRPIIGVFVLIQTIDCISLFDIIYVVTHGGPGRSTETITFITFRNSFLYFHLGYSSAIALIGILFCFSAAWLITKVFGESRL
jgi:multiple sugar transport system permease protein